MCKYLLRKGQQTKGGGGGVTPLFPYGGVLLLRRIKHGLIEPEVVTLGCKKRNEICTMVLY